MKSIANVSKSTKVNEQADASLTDRMAKALLLKTLAKLKKGHLTIDDNGEFYSFGERKESASVIAHIQVNHPSAYKQVLLNGTIGSGEAYMQGLWWSPDLTQVIRIFVLNMQVVADMDSGWNRALQFAANIGHRFRANSKSQARLNIAAHYDLGNDFFKLFLDETMLYSAAIFPTSQATLFEASTHKMRHICERLSLSSDDHLLEIGTGWGGMAIFAAKHYGCKVTSVTISKEQYEHACDWVKQENLEHLVSIQLKDYRDLEGSFDKLLSIEMIEAVGYQYYSEYFAQCARLLKPEGKMLIQAITIADQRYHIERDNADFIQAYIFPGGCLPSIEVIAKHLRKDTDMQMIGLEDITFHYAKTLKLWRERFFANIEQVREQGFDDTFIKMWEFYLCYCEGGFMERVISTSQILMAKPRCGALPEHCFQGYQ